MAGHDEEAHNLEEARLSSSVPVHAEEGRSINKAKTIKLPEAPKSSNFRLPLKMTEVHKKKQDVPPPRLIHP